MCRKRAILATVLGPALLLAVSGPVTAWAGDKPAPAAAAAPTAEPAPRKATPAQRAEVMRADPLTRMAFWSAEADRDGRDVEAAVGLSQALRALGRYDEAADAADRILIVAPDSYDALMEVARANIARGQGFYAIEPGRKAAGLPTSTIQVRQNLALVVGLQGRIDEAEKLARQDLPPESVDNNLAWLRAATGQPSATRSWSAVKAGG